MSMRTFLVAGASFLLGAGITPIIAGAPMLQIGAVIVGFLVLGTVAAAEGHAS